MPLSTEIFVMSIFIAGLPFFIILLRDPELKGHSWFLTAYISLMFSNIFTVAEEFCCNYFFNFCEHLFIALSSFFMVIAILQFSSFRKETDLEREGEDQMNED
jgi:hypothetical protein